MDSRPFIEHIASGVQSLGQQVADEDIQRFAGLLCELDRWNARINLTAIRDPAEMVSGHLLDSLAIRPLIEGKSLIDIGTGAGFPGFPMAVLRPDCQFTLVESHARKSVFLREASRELPNIRVVEQRAESLSLRFDWIVSRGVRWKKPLDLVPRLGDHIALLLGESDAAELRRKHEIAWSPTTRLPWGERRVMLTGCVPRGT